MKTNAVKDFGKLNIRIFASCVSMGYANTEEFYAWLRSKELSNDNKPQLYNENTYKQALTHLAGEMKSWLK